MSRRFQFSLRGLFVVMLGVAIAAVPFGYLLRRPVEVPVAGTVKLDGATLPYVVPFLAPTAKAENVGQMRSADLRFHCSQAHIRSQ
jgi:hypothetical protein